MNVKSGVLDLIERLEVAVNGVLRSVAKHLGQHIAENRQSVGVIRQSELVDGLGIVLDLVVQSDHVIQSDDRGLAGHKKHRRFDVRHMLTLRHEGDTKFFRRDFRVTIVHSFGYDKAKRVVRAYIYKLN